MNKNQLVMNIERVVFINAKCKTVLYNIYIKCFKLITIIRFLLLTDNEKGNILK